MDVFDFAVLVNDDANRNAIKFVIGEYRLNPLKDVVACGEIPDTHGSCGSSRGLAEQASFVHLTDHAFQQFRIATGELEHHRVTTDLGGKRVPVQLGGRRHIVKANKRVSAELYFRRLLFDFEISTQFVAAEVDQLKSAVRRNETKKQILS